MRCALRPWATIPLCCVTACARRTAAACIRNRWWMWPGPCCTSGRNAEEWCLDASRVGDLRLFGGRARGPAVCVQLAARLAAGALGQPRGGAAGRRCAWPGIRWWITWPGPTNAAQTPPPGWCGMSAGKDFLAQISRTRRCWRPRPFAPGYRGHAADLPVGHAAGCEGACGQYPAHGRGAAASRCAGGKRIFLKRASTAWPWPAPHRRDSPQVEPQAARWVDLCAAWLSKRFALTLMDE